MRFKVILSFIVLTGFVFLNGCGSDTTTPVTPTTGTVNGKVVDQTGNPISGVTAVIGSTNAVTGADGSFTINSVTTPYSVKLLFATGATGMSYQGISTLTPQLLGLGLASTPSTATLSVTIPALGVNQRATVIYTDGALVHSSTTISNPQVIATVNVTWQNSAPITGKAIVLVYTVNGTGAVVTFDKYGEKTNIALNNLGTSSITFLPADLNVTPTTQTVAGTTTAPAGYNAPSTRLALRFTTQGTALLGAQVGAVQSGTNFSFMVPGGLTSAFTIGLEGTATSPVFEQTIKLLNATVGSSNTITLETPSALSTPIMGATNIDTTTNFTYGTGTGTGIYIVLFQSTVPTTKNFYVFTNSASVTIPSFSAFGLSLGANTAYNWKVIKFGSMATVNDFVSSAVFNNTSFNMETVSQSRTFTTTP